MATPPDPAASRAVLIGVGKFDSLASLPAVENSVRTLGGLLTRTDIWGLPEDNCHVVVNPQTPRELSKPVSEAADQATDTLLVYYAGHGLLEPGTGQLHLAVGHSDQRSVHDTAAPYDWIRRAIERSPAARRIVIADCCYSARAFGVQSAKAHLEVDGTFLLAAAAENAVAIAPPGEDFTAFTGELIKLLDNGIQEAGEYLDLDTIYRVLRVELGLREMPEPHRLCRDHLGKAPFVRNIAFKPPIEENGANGAGHEEPGQTPGPGTPADLSDLQIVLSELLLRMATSRSLADTLQTVANGVVSGLGYELAAVNLVRPDGDLVVAAFAGDEAAVAQMTGRVGPRAAWDRRLGMGERWGSLIFIPHSEGWVLDEDDVPQWYTDGPEPRFEDEWHPSDRLFAPLWANATLPGELIGVISVDRPRNSRRPGTWQREALQVYAAHAAVAISNARLRANMQRALVRLEREQQALRASEESFRQAFEYAPSGMAIAEMGGDQSGRMMRTNDALCRILGRPASALRRYSFADLVHAEDIGTLLRTSAEGGRAELRLARRDNTYVWVSLRNSVVADAADGPRFLLTHVEDIEERKRRERQLTHDGVTGLLNAEGVRWRLSSLLCGVSPALAMVPAAERPTDPLHGGQPSAPDWLTVGGHTHVTTPSYEHDCSRGLAVLLCQLRGSGWMGNRMGGRTSDAVLMEIARRLSSTVRTGDTVARLSDDEFVVLAEHLDVQQAQDLSSALRESLGSAVRAGDGPARAKAEVILRWASCGMTAEELLRPTNRHRRSTS